MPNGEKQSVALISLSAAFCDRRKTDEEREQIRTLLDNLSSANCCST